MTNSYYATTAYDSSKPRQLAPLDRNDMGLAERTVRRHRLFSNGSQCREYLANSYPVSTVLELQDMSDKEHQEILDRNLHEYFQWQTGKNIAALVDSVGYVAGWFWLFGGVFGGLIGFIVRDFEMSMGMFYGFIITFVIPFTVWLFGKIAIKRGWFKDENNIIFNRRTGMVTIPRAKNETISLPFDEFDPYLSSAMTTAASTNQFLRLVHRYSDVVITNPSGFSKSRELFLTWEEVQQFMDISQPLPDIPEYDFARENDPVTAAYDKKYQRPKNYWKSVPTSEVRKMFDASIEAAEKFPWKKTREQALQLGWQASGVGEGAWRRHDASDAA